MSKRVLSFFAVFAIATISIGAVSAATTIHDVSITPSSYEKGSDPSFVISFKPGVAITSIKPATIIFPPTDPASSDFRKKGYWFNLGNFFSDLSPLSLKNNSTSSNPATITLKPDTANPIDPEQEIRIVTGPEGIISPTTPGEYPIIIRVGEGNEYTVPIKIIEMSTQTVGPPVPPVAATLPPTPTFDQEFNEVTAQENCGSVDFGCKVANKIGRVLLLIPTLIINIIKLILGFILFIVIELFNLVTNIKVSEGPAKTGFDITLQLANIGFVIAIIVIGFATILRKESYAMKKALPKLIIVAILINFSFFLANAAINFSDELTKVFSTSLSAKTFEFRGFRQEYTSGLGGLAAIILSPLFELIFNVLLIFAVLAATVMFIIRYVWLSLLIIGLPIALLLSIFPDLSIGGAGGAWKQWFEKFTSWLIFGPVAMFFIWLSATFKAGSDKSGDDSFIIMIASIAILTFGLMVAEKLGLSGAESAGALAGWATRRGAGLMARGAARGYGRLRRHQPTREERGAEAFRGVFGDDNAPSDATRLQTTGETMKGVPTPQGEDALDALHRASEPRPTTSEAESSPAPAGGGATGASATLGQKEKMSFRERIGKGIGKTGGFLADQTEEFLGVRLTPKGIKEWGEGGPSFKNILKGGIEELIGDKEKGPLKGLFEHSKGEKYDAKLKKIDDLIKKFDEYNKGEKLEPKVEAKIKAIIKIAGNDKEKAKDMLVKTQNGLQTAKLKAEFELEDIKDIKKQKSSGVARSTGESHEGDGEHN